MVNVSSCSDVIYVKREFIPPQFSQSFREFGVVKLRILIRQSASRRLSPNHERVHRTFHVSASSAARARSDRKQGPVVAWKR